MPDQTIEASHRADFPIDLHVHAREAGYIKRIVSQVLASEA